MQYGNSGLIGEDLNIEAVSQHSRVTIKLSSHVGVPDDKIALLLSLKPVLTVEKAGENEFVMTTITPKGTKTLNFAASENAAEVELTKADAPVVIFTITQREGSLEQISPI